MKKVLELDGRSMNGGKSFAKVREVEQFYSQIFDFLATRLKARDRMDQYNRGPQPVEIYRSPTRDPRYVKIATEGEQDVVRPGESPRNKTLDRNEDTSSTRTPSPTSSTKSTRPATPPRRRTGPTPKNEAPPPPPPRSQDTRTSWSGQRGGDSPSYSHHTKEREQVWKWKGQG